jgi:hypothetical protein
MRRIHEYRDIPRAHWPNYLKLNIHLRTIRKNFVRAIEAPSIHTVRLIQLSILAHKLALSRPACERQTDFSTKADASLDVTGDSALVAQCEPGRAKLPGWPT